jgi:hypothetical protein
MVKYLALAIVMVGSLVMVDMASARGHRGCASCGGCPGGVCAVPVAAGPVKAAVVAPGAPVVAVTPAPQYTVSARRGLFGWRR